MGFLVTCLLSAVEGRWERPKPGSLGSGRPFGSSYRSFGAVRLTQQSQNPGGRLLPTWLKVLNTRNRIVDLRDMVK